MQKYLKEIEQLAVQLKKPIKLMEVCGTHTQVVAEYGLKKFLPANVELVSGPGCPVCVTDQRDIDAVVEIALAGAPIFCYGDVMRVPGTKMCLAEAAQQGAQVRAVYSVSEIEDWIPTFAGMTKGKAGMTERGAGMTESKKSPQPLRDYGANKGYGDNKANKIANIKSPRPPFQKGELREAVISKVERVPVFFGIGFETTAPMTALAVKRGLTVYSAHKSFVPAMQALLASGEVQIDGLISPGHVAAITGWRAFDSLRTAGGERMPQVVAGFELEDILRAIVMLLRQIVSGEARLRQGLQRGEAKTENEYTRVVSAEGNKKAQKLLQDVFDLRDGYWRGLGNIPATGFELKKEFAKQDAKVIYKDIIEKVFGREPAVKNKCLCGQVIKGLISSEKCPMFGKKCNPENPQGPCMVSVEGSCYVKYSNC